ncbi:flagellar biosynthetic protein FliO [Brockia lithotrophica]|uniref:Flagellar biosynthesis protein FliO n=1 Tax=Brockia lithotrophica TaxID=933949 RepID=A0A660KW08_9BACL|nr:flagellar biosynthetic protein FliO [Brockia lithotrophica]RKQ84203.1 flagellar biosynthesis protein FliO [Brockia lithotrophica]
MPVFALGGGPTVDEWLRGAPNSGEPPLPAATGEPLFLVLVKVFAFFLLLGFLGWIALRLARRKAWGDSPEGAEVLFRVPVAPGKYVAALRLGRSVYLLGVGEDVHLLEVLAAEEVERTSQPPPSGGSSLPAWGERFFSLLVGAAENAATKEGKGRGTPLPSGKGREGAEGGESLAVTEEERRLRDLFRRGE